METENKKIIQLSNRVLSERVPLAQDRQVQDSIQVWAWLNQPGIAKSSQGIYLAIVKEFFKLNYDVGLKEVKVGHISLYLKQNLAHSAATRNLRRSCLSSLFQFLEDSGYISLNPVRVIKPQKVAESFQFKVLSFQQVERMVQVSAGIARNSLLLKVLYYAGLRISEALSLQKSSFRTAEDGVYLTVTGKGSKTRTVRLPEELWEEIQDYIRAEDLTPAGFLFSHAGERSRPLSRVQAWAIVKSIAKKAKIDPVPSPHWFRHTSATHAIENGAPVHVVQATLGHASMTTTGKYLRARPQESNAKFLKKMR